MSSLRHGAPLRAKHGSGFAALRRGTAHSVRVRSAIRRVRDNKATGRAARGKAPVVLRGVDRAAEHAYTSHPLPVLLSLAWHAAMPLERSAYPLRAGYAQVSR